MKNRNTWQTDIILTSSSSKHDEQHRVEEPETYSEDVLMEDRREKEDETHRHRATRLTKGLRTGTETSYISTQQHSTVFYWPICFSVTARLTNRW